jgi:hypothetical protein
MMTRSNSANSIGGGNRYPLLRAAGVHIACTAPGNPGPNGVDFNHLGNPPIVWATLHSASSARQSSRARQRLMVNAATPTNRRVGKQCGDRRAVTKSALRRQRWICSILIHAGCFGN